MLSTDTAKKRGIRVSRPGHRSEFNKKEYLCASIFFNSRGETFVRDLSKLLKQIDDVEYGVGSFAVQSGELCFNCIKFLHNLKRKMSASLVASALLD